MECADDRPTRRRCACALRLQLRRDGLGEERHLRPELRRTLQHDAAEGRGPSNAGGGARCGPVHTSDGLASGVGRGQDLGHREVREPFPQLGARGPRSRVHPRLEGLRCAPRLLVRLGLQPGGEATVPQRRRRQPPSLPKGVPGAGAIGLYDAALQAGLRDAAPQARFRDAALQARLRQVGIPPRHHRARGGAARGAGGSSAGGCGAAYAVVRQLARRRRRTDRRGRHNDQGGSGHRGVARGLAWQRVPGRDDGELRHQRTALAAPTCRPQRPDEGGCAEARPLRRGARPSLSARGHDMAALRRRPGAADVLPTPAGGRPPAAHG
mmetsp:Transcript_12583/g.36191  ORF Transcript_12583/g.36191 Transcript_12583/m.36191 type:complete len:325 (+) Transcript_12583:480-1454(+)